MKRLLAIVVLIFACTPCSSADRMIFSKEGPVLLANGRGYTIHVFNGAVQGNVFHSRVAGSGIVVFHTKTGTGETTWMMSTGTFEIPTVRISYSVSRLLGLFQSGTHIAMVTYHSGRIYGRLPHVPPPEQGGYRLIVFEKASGKKQFDVELDLSRGRPNQVPKETAELGIVKKTEDGFSVLGTSFLVLEDGSIRKKGSKKKNALDKK